MPLTARLLPANSNRRCRLSQCYQVAALTAAKPASKKLSQERRHAGAVQQPRCNVQYMDCWPDNCTTVQKNRCESMRKKACSGPTHRCKVGVQAVEPGPQVQLCDGGSQA